MTEQVPSDSLLPTLRRMCEQMTGPVIIGKPELLALVNCAEVLQRQCESGCGCAECHDGREALKALEALKR